MSRWFVGSSMIRKSAFCNIMQARATRLASPPDSSLIGWSSRSIFSCDSTCLIFCSISQLPEASIEAIARSKRLLSPLAKASSYSRISGAILPMRVYTSSNIVFRGLKSKFWSRKATRISFINFTSPPRSELSTPARIFINDDFPVPFGATRAILSPSLMLKLIFENRVRSPYDFDTFST